MIMPPEAVISPPDPTIVTGRNVFPDEVHKQIQAAMDAKGNPPAPAQPASPTPASPAPSPAAASPKPKVPPQPAPPAQPAQPAQPAPKAGDEPKYPRSALQWEEWKKKTTDEYEAKIREIQAQIKPADTSALDKLKSERDTLAKQLQLVAIERDPAFNREFDTATSAVIAAAKSASGKHAEAIEKVLRMAPSEARDMAIEKLMEDVPPYKQTQIGYALAEMDKLRNLKQAKIQEAQANWEQLQSRSVEERTHAQQAERAEMSKVLDRTIAQWSDKEKGLPVLQKRDNDAAWNTQIDDSIQLARDIFGGELDIDSLARASLWAASAPLLLKDNATLLEQIKAKDAEIAQLKGLSPGADGQTGLAPTGEQPNEIPEGTDYAKAIGMAVRRAGLNMQ